MYRDPFSFQGRIGRKKFSISAVIVGLLCGILIFLLIRVSKHLSEGMGLVLGYLLSMGAYVGYWFLLAQGCKRCHDMGKSGWLQCVPFYFILMFLKRGGSGSNAYGPNPGEMKGFNLFLSYGEKPAEYEDAHSFYRLSAFAIDLSIVIWLVLIITAITGSGILLSNAFIFLLCLILIYLVYSIVIENRFCQGTLGKWIFRLRVTDVSGKNISLSRTVRRNGTKLISLLVYLLQTLWFILRISLILALGQDTSDGFIDFSYFHAHDKLSGTTVERIRI
ncbi:RDD family protein [bacterium]|nr:RDD family protein [bacterium]